MDKKFKFVYCTINIITGKCYIGSHGTNIENDGYLGSGSYLKKSLKKYGKEKFIRIIIKNCNTIIESRKLEEYYIRVFDTLYPNGYNISESGGQGEWGGKLSKEYRIKISNSMKGKNKGKIPWNKGLKMNEEFSDKTLKGIKEKRSKNPNYLNGFNEKLTDEHKLKISKSRKGQKHSEETKIKIGLGHKGLKYKNNSLV